MAPDEPGDGISEPKSGSRAHTCWRVKLRPWEKIGTWVTLCRRGFLRRVDRPRAPRNLRSPAGEELVGKNHRRRGDQTAMTLSGGFRKENKVTGRKKKIRFSSLALIPCEERK